MASILNLFVRGHHLSIENKGAVIGVDREKSDIRQPGSLPGREFIEFVGVREDGSRP